MDVASNCAHDRLVQIPFYFMLQYRSRGYQWARINSRALTASNAVLVVYLPGRPIVTSRNKRVVTKTWHRFRFAVVSIQPDLESNSSLGNYLYKFRSGSSVNSRSRSRNISQRNVESVCKPAPTSWLTALTNNMSLGKGCRNVYAPSS